MKTQVLVLFSLVLLAVSAFAALPVSSYMDGEAFYGDEPGYEGNLKGSVNYAVYDTDALSLADEMSLAGALGLAGRYIYAYQIWNDYPVSESAVASFEVLYKDDTEVGASILNDTGARDDGDGGIAPSTISSQGLWEWSMDNGYLASGEHSYFLVFSSDQAPIAGKFEVKGPESDVPVPPETPEPATVALLGIGGFTVLRRVRRRV